jgi:hypothetical protein
LEKTAAVEGPTLLVMCRVKKKGKKKKYNDLVMSVMSVR